MGKDPEEWLKQADYDMKTAESNFAARRYIHVVFMCHISVEKALKGLYLQNLAKDPPKTHNLYYLVDEAEINLPEEMIAFLVALSEKSVPTRYPEDLQVMVKYYNKRKTGEILNNAKELLKWIKEQYQE